jgi:hypothetical protein
VSFFILFCIFVLAVVGFFATVGMLIYRTFHAIRSNPEGAGFQETVKRMQNELNTVGNLAPWAPDTLELVCARPITQLQKGWFLQSNNSGVLGTIYQEPIANYTKTNLGNSFLLLVGTQTDTFLYRKTSKQTEIWINQELAGVLVENNLLSGDNKGKLLAQLENDVAQTRRTVFFDGKPALSILMKPSEEDINPRAVETIIQPQTQDTKLTQALVFLHIVGI